MGVTVIDLEFGYENFCKIISYHDIYKNYYGWDITEE